MGFFNRKRDPSIGEIMKQRDEEEARKLEETAEGQETAPAVRESIERPDISPEAMVNKADVIIAAAGERVGNFWGSICSRTRNLVERAGNIKDSVKNKLESSAEAVGRAATDVKEAVVLGGKYSLGVALSAPELFTYGKESVKGTGEELLDIGAGELREVKDAATNVVEGAMEKGKAAMEAAIGCGIAVKDKASRTIEDMTQRYRVHKMARAERKVEKLQAKLERIKTKFMAVYEKRDREEIEQELRELLVEWRV